MADKKKPPSPRGNFIEEDQLEFQYDNVRVSHLLVTCLCKTGHGDKNQTKKNTVEANQKERQG
jgi:hypothetical protein